MKMYVIQRKRTGGKMKIALYGASDRYNYGDIMMPIIFKEWFDRNSICHIEYINCALTQADMSYCGGLKTISIKDLPKVDALVVTGGETMGTILTDIACNVLRSEQEIEIFLFKVLRKTFPVFLNRYLQNRYKLSTPYLFALDNTKYMTIYNTVGGSMSYRPETTREDYEKALLYVRQATYISCRTCYDTNELRKLLCEKAQCYPDSVVLISQIYPKQKLKELCSRTIIKSIQQRYYVFQACYLNKEEVEAVAMTIEAIYRELGIKCFLLPIAYAQNHDDVETLEKLHKLCDKATIFPTQTTIYETAAVLAFADAYCGTSLHGVVTAISYAVPHCTWRSTHYKTVRFLETWKTTKYVYADQTNAKEVLLQLLNDKENRQILEGKRLELIAKANRNFKNIDEILLEYERKNPKEKDDEV